MMEDDAGFLEEDEFYPEEGTVFLKQEIYNLFDIQLQLRKDIRDCMNKIDKYRKNSDSATMRSDIARQRIRASELKREYNFNSRKLKELDKTLFDQTNILRGIYEIEDNRVKLTTN